MKTKNKLFKVTALVMSLVMTAGVLSGCKDSGNADGKVHISVAGWPSKEGAALDNANKTKAEFEAKYPDVVVEPDTWQLDMQTFYPKAEAGMLPNLFTIHFTELKRIADGGYAYDLSDVLKDNGFEGKFSQRAIDVVTQNGKVIAFPYNMYMLGLAYNTKMFEAAGLMEADGTPKQPKDWMELVEFAKKIKAATGKAGFIIPTTNNCGGWFFTNIAWSFGTDFMKQRKDGTWEATFDTPETVAALQFIKDLKWKHDVFSNNTLISLDEQYKEYAVGNVGIIISPGDIQKNTRKYGMPIEEYGLMAIPKGPARHVSLLGGGVNCISANSTKEQADAAVKYIKQSYTYELTDAFKEKYMRTINTTLEEGGVIGPETINIWAGDTDVRKYQNEITKEYCNININAVRLYNESLNDDKIEVQEEEPMGCQDLYSILDNCIQRVLADESADCAELIRNANRDFQVNFLDKVAY